MRYLATPFALDPDHNDGVAAPEGTATHDPNAWGLHDMHGNVQEWTSSLYKPYPYRANDGRETRAGSELRVVRGGSWADRPRDARASIRRFYPPWQRVWNVGIRVVVEPEQEK
jgi:formylglycine-generating enzyme required for sulfatase activity